MIRAGLDQNHSSSQSSNHFKSREYGAVGKRILLSVLFPCSFTVARPARTDLECEKREDVQ